MTLAKVRKKMELYMEEFILDHRYYFLNYLKDCCPFVFHVIVMHLVYVHAVYSMKLSLILEFFFYFFLQIKKKSINADGGCAPPIF